MNKEELRAALAETAFFRGAPPEILESLAGVAQWATFPMGSYLFRQGDPAHSFHVLVRGRVSVEICSPGFGCERILTVVPGELLGWSPLLEAGHLTASARAVEAVESVQLPGAAVLELCEENPRFGYEIMRRTAAALAQRLNATRLQLLDLYRHPASIGRESPR